MWSSARLKAGDWVQVKSQAEILATLDQQGRLDGLPFMPEMLKHCGQRLRVFKRAHKVCDPPSGLSSRRLLDTVLLEDVRCDGQAHGGCQAACLIFWKEAWLKPLDTASVANSVTRPAPGCTEAELRAATVRGNGTAAGAEPIYTCQVTELFNATTPLAWWDMRQYVEDYRSGNVRLSQLLAALLFTVYAAVAEAGVGLGGLRWVYDRFQRLRGGDVYPLRRGRIPLGQPTPVEVLDLAPGELVRIKSFDTILGTLNEQAHNRGMYFDSELVPFCGKTYRVLRRVEKIVDERKGSMLKLKTGAIVLEGVTCEARYATCRRFCPKAVPLYWREIWLERVKS
jgi:hypothetical protein